MSERCIYCGYRVGDTKDHIVPKSFLRRHFGGGGDWRYHCPELNLAPSCQWCNRSKSAILYLPTLRNTHGIYSNTPMEYVKSLADWVYEYSDRLLRYIPLELYGATDNEVKEVLALYELGYYDYMYALYKEN